MGLATSSRAKVPGRHLPGLQRGGKRSCCGDNAHVWPNLGPAVQLQHQAPVSRRRRPGYVHCILGLNPSHGDPHLRIRLLASVAMNPAIARPATVIAVRFARPRRTDRGLRCPAAGTSSSASTARSSVTRSTTAKAFASATMTSAPVGWVAGTSPKDQGNAWRAAWTGWPRTRTNSTRGTGASRCCSCSGDGRCQQDSTIKHVMSRRSIRRRARELSFKHASARPGPRLSVALLARVAGARGASASSTARTMRW